MKTSPVRRILAAVDFSDCSRVALDFARALAGSLGASVEVLYVAERAQAPSPVELAAADQELADFLASSKLPEAIVTTRRIEFGDPRERIVAIADSEPFDLIVLGTHGRTGRVRMLAGSVAESVVRTASRPVLTVRGPQ
jgi:nucleotide-binding universal stress UspA family protein